MVRPQRSNSWRYPLLASPCYRNDRAKSSPGERRGYVKSKLFDSAPKVFIITVPRPVCIGNTRARVSITM